MKLPNLSHLVYVGQLRHIQSVYEEDEYRNPDGLVRYFLSCQQLWNCSLRGRLLLQRLRSKPFYYYVLARTRYYDEVFVSAIAQGVRHILNIGCGTDTRAYRFSMQLNASHVSYVECDQYDSIREKQRMAQSRFGFGDVRYMPLDLNSDDFGQLEDWLQRTAGEKALVMAEGVSPYIDRDAFLRFMRLLAERLPEGSLVAYDFKVQGVADAFGRSARVNVPFRMTSDVSEVAALHGALGLRLERLESGVDMAARTLPGLRKHRPHQAMFSEDALVVLSKGMTAEMRRQN